MVTTLLQFSKRFHSESVCYITKQVYNKFPKEIKWKQKNIAVENKVFGIKSYSTTIIQIFQIFYFELSEMDANVVGEHCENFRAFCSILHQASERPK